MRGIQGGVLVLLAAAWLAPARLDVAGSQPRVLEIGHDPQLFGPAKQ